MKANAMGGYPIRGEDNFSTHVSNRVKKEAEQLGIYLVYLPPYSPDLNPIEFIWKSIKRAISIVFVELISKPSAPS